MRFRIAYKCLKCKDIDVSDYPLSRPCQKCGQSRDNVLSWQEIVVKCKSTEIWWNPFTWGSFTYTEVKKNNDRQFS